MPPLPDSRLVWLAESRCNFVPTQAHIECRSSVFECNREAEHVAVVLSALGYIRHDEYCGSTNHHWIFCSHRVPPGMGQPQIQALAGIPICSFHIMIAMLI